MKALAKTTVILALLPMFIGNKASSDKAIAQTIVPSDTTTQINLSNDGILDISGGTQASSNLFHSFEQFNLEQQQTANFIAAPNTDSIIGQVIGGSASTIDGLLQVTGSNADLYLINPAGLIFGPNARLDLGGSFTATTATHIGDETQWFDVLSAPDYSTLITPPSHFAFSQSSFLVNQGHLTVSDGNSLRLIAPQITNTGELTAPNGEITLLAPTIGQSIYLRQPGGVLSLEITDTNNYGDHTLPALITGGDTNHSDALIIDNNGEVALVNHETASEPFVSLQNTGNISTQGYTGGEINLLGNTIQVANSTLNTSGNTGGVIRIGGDYQGQGPLPRAAQTTITETTSLIADAIEGNGGQVIVWSDNTTIFDGTISAQSTQGDGGLVETSGLNQLTIGENATVTTAAPQGDTGMWLLDPTELTVVDSDGSGIIVAGTNDNASSIDASTIVAALDTTNVALQATDAITITEAIDASGNSISSNLFLDTATLNLNEQITLQGSGQLSGTATTVNVGSNGSIQNGVDAVADGGTVNLAATTYREGNTVILDKPLSLIGQGNDGTFISGDADNNGVGDHQVLKITSNGDNITLTALTIQDGRSTSDGAGLENNGKNVLISNTNFINNEITSSNQDGGAIHNDGSLTLLNTSFENNRTGSDGGAIDIEQGSVEIVDSYFSNNQANGHGGAIDVDPNGSLVISNSILTGNSANTDGGAIYLEGEAKLDEPTFSANTAIMDGGAIYNNDGTLKIRNSNFDENSSDNGGAIALSGASTLEIENSLLDGNLATNLGGAIAILGNNLVKTNNLSLLNNTAANGGGIYNRGDISLLNSVISNNQATGLDTSNGGGGILNASGGMLVVNSSLIANNTSNDLGGGILSLADGTQTIVEILNSSIVGNQAANKGGGVENASLNSFSNLAILTISDSTISGNQAATGGGIRTVGSTMLTNVTIAENIATGSGGGISENQTTIEIPELINTIVAKNKAPINPDVEGLFNDQGNNLIGISQVSTGFNLSTLVGTDSTPLDPNITSLNNNIGSLPSHQLLIDSPAANAGNNLVANATDQHGQPRIVGSIVDIGAVESDILLNSAVTPTDIDGISPTDINNLETQSDPLTPDSNNPQASQTQQAEIFISQLPRISPVPTDPQQTIPGNSAGISSVNLNGGDILVHQTKPANTRNLEQGETRAPSSNGRLRYLDEEAFQYLEDSFSKDYEDYWQLPETAPVTLPSIQYILNQANQEYQTESAIIYATFVPQASTDENAIERFVLPRTQHTPSPDDQLLLLLVPANGEPVQELINVSRTELTQQAKLFRLATSDPEDSLSYKALARQMNDWLLAPLQEDLAANNIDHVMYSLDQGLRTIPLAAMMQGDIFVIEQYGVSLIPSMGLTQFQVGDITPKPQPLIAGANQFKTLEDLPAVPIELDIVAQNFQSNDVLLNETFTLDNFLTAQTSQQPNLLHLATHAEFHAGNLEQSFIQFWDSPLRFDQMKNLTWAELELLILSACETAISSPEAELGFVGLAAAAGIETSMGSLWNVSDIATLALMAEFYTQLPDGAIRANALQKAQLSLLRGETHISNNALNTSQENISLPEEWGLPTADFSHPFYWAGFTMVGNPWR